MGSSSIDFTGWIPAKEHLKIDRLLGDLPYADRRFLCFLVSIDTSVNDAMIFNDLELSFPQGQSRTYDTVHLLPLLNTPLLISSQSTHKKHVPRVATCRRSCRKQSKSSANRWQGFARRSSSCHSFSSTVAGSTSTAVTFIIFCTDEPCETFLFFLNWVRSSIRIWLIISFFISGIWFLTFHLDFRY